MCTVVHALAVRAFLSGGSRSPTSTHCTHIHTHTCSTHTLCSTHVAHKRQHMQLNKSCSAYIIVHQDSEAQAAQHCTACTVYWLYTVWSPHHISHVPQTIPQTSYKYSDMVHYVWSPSSPWPAARHLPWLHCSAQQPSPVADLAAAGPPLDEFEPPSWMMMRTAQGAHSPPPASS